MTERIRVKISSYRLPLDGPLEYRTFGYVVENFDTPDPQMRARIRTERIMGLGFEDNQFLWSTSCPVHRYLAEAEGRKKEEIAIQFQSDPHHIFIGARTELLLWKMLMYLGKCDPSPFILLRTYPYPYTDLERVTRYEGYLGEHPDFRGVG